PRARKSRTPRRRPASYATLCHDAHIRIRAAGRSFRNSTLRDPYPSDWKAKLARFLLDLDSRIDFAIFQSGRRFRESYERFAAFMDRFHVSGLRRFAVEGLSEGATLGLGGLIVMLALAMPAFQETSDDDWLKKSELAVT